MLFLPFAHVYEQKVIIAYPKIEHKNMRNRVDGVNLGLVSLWWDTKIFSPTMNIIKGQK